MSRDGGAAAEKSECMNIVHSPVFKKGWRLQRRGARFTS